MALIQKDLIRQQVKSEFVLYIIRIDNLSKMTASVSFRIEAF